MLGVALVTRVISIVDAVRDARSSNRQLDNSFSQTDRFNYEINLDPLSDTRQVSFTLFTPF